MAGARPPKGVVKMMAFESIAARVIGGLRSSRGGAHVGLIHAISHLNGGRGLHVHGSSNSSSLSCGNHSGGVVVFAVSCMVASHIVITFAPH